MSKNKRKNRPQNEGLNNNAATDTNITPAADFDPYNDDKTKEIVGSLFDEFVEDGGTNYFADYSDPFLDTENDDTESLRESISRRRRRSVAPAKKSIVFRMKPKKKKSEEFYEEDDLEDEIPDDDDISLEDTDTSTSISDDDIDEPGDMEKTIILPKLSNFFKKSSDKEADIDEDDDTDDFFAELNKKSEARSQAAASQEEEIDNDEISYEAEHIEESPRPARKRRAKNIFADLENPYDTGLNKNKNDEEDEDDDYDEKIVEVNLMRTLGAALVVIFIVVIIALCVKNNSLSKQLTEANDTITELRKSGNSSTLSTAVDELQAENESLKAELESLNGSSAASDDHAAAVEILGDSISESTTAAQSSSGSTGSTTYTVKSGDNFWKISQSVYGNGANYQKILDANNLTENSQLNEGQVLTIPN